MIKSSTRIHEPSEVELKALRRAKRMIELFRTLEPRMPSSYIDAFLTVALKPGLGPTEYARELHTLQPIASRILMEIGNYARERENALGLVDRQLSSTSAAKHEYFLTPDGRRLMAQVVDIMTKE